MLAAHAGRCAEAVAGEGESGASDHRLRPGSDEVGTEGAANGNAKQGGRHFFYGSEEEKKKFNIPSREGS